MKPIAHLSDLSVADTRILNTWFRKLWKFVAIGDREITLAEFGSIVRRYESNWGSPDVEHGCDTLSQLVRLLPGTFHVSERVVKRRPNSHGSRMAFVRLVTRPKKAAPTP